MPERGACRNPARGGVRGRRADASFGIEPEPAALFWGRHLIVVAALMFVGWKLAQFCGLPNVLIVMSVLIVLYAFFTEQTVIGRRIYALGGNEKAARLSGIKTDRLVFATFANMGVLAALAGLIVTARTNSGTPKASTGFELDVIAAVFFGGRRWRAARGGSAGHQGACAARRGNL